MARRGFRKDSRDGPGGARARRAAALALRARARARLHELKALSGFIEQYQRRGRRFGSVVPGRRRHLEHLSQQTQTSSAFDFFPGRAGSTSSLSLSLSDDFCANRDGWRRRDGRSIPSSRPIDGICACC